jgi:hypothetical protein
VPNEPPNGFGTGGYVTIQSSNKTRGFALRLPDNYDKNKPSGWSSGFTGTAATPKLTAVEAMGTTWPISDSETVQQRRDLRRPTGSTGWYNNSGRSAFVDDMVS